MKTSGWRYSRIGGVCATLVTVVLMAAISFGEVEAPAPEPLVTALPVDATARPFVADGEPTLVASGSFPVECSQVPDSRDCLYY